MDGGAWWAAVHGVAEGRTRLSDFTFTFYFHALEKEMATHSSVLAWRIPGTGEPGGLPSMRSHRVGHDWSDLAAVADILQLVLICYLKVNIILFHHHLPELCLFDIRNVLIFFYSDNSWESPLTPYKAETMIMADQINLYLDSNEKTNKQIAS